MAGCSRRFCAPTWHKLGSRGSIAGVPDFEAYLGKAPLPFEAGEHKRIAVKIVDDRGIESLKVMEVK